jgi:hypothetical protein
MAKTLSYSHPVLGNGDDFTIEWEIETYDEPIPPNYNCGVPVTRICIECVQLEKKLLIIFSSLMRLLYFWK